MLVFSINSQVYGESNERIDISEYLDKDGNAFVSDFAEVRQTDKIVFEIGKDTTVHVKHIIIGDMWQPHEPKVIKMLPGKHSNLEVTDEDGDNLRPIGFVGETFEESEYIIAGQKAHAGYDLVAEYDLENFLELNDGLWTKNFDFPHDVMIHVDDEVEIIFANSRPVDISDAEGVNCMGCNILIEFFDNSEPITKTVIRTDTKFEEISNTGEEYSIEFLSDGVIGELNFIDELKYLSFDVNQENQLFLIKIPLDLLLSPYHVFLSEIDQDILVDSDQIRKSEFEQNATHANLSFRANTEGVIHIVGSTEMEHEKLLDKLEKRIPEPVEEIIENVKKSDEELNDTTKEQLFEDWGDTSSNVNNNEDNTMIFVIIGGVVIAVIIGIVIKLKKN
ncbi:MAG: hypothetical protein HOL90_03600 [Candidatus Nitrosopelagicus sp.]|nr:hypothetical protein [Candidatus Nitrosopelagicus sp.]